MPDERKRRYPGVYPSGRTSFQYKLRLPPNPDTGTRPIETRGGYATEHEAHLARSARQVELGLGVNTAPSDLTVTQAVEQWIAGRTMKPNTRYTYSTLLARYITPHIGSVRVRDLTPARVRQWQVTLSTAGKRRGTGGLSPATVNLTRALLASTFHQLHRDGSLARNVVAMVDGIPSRTYQPDTWDNDEMTRFLAVADLDPYAALWRLCLLSLLRPGEVIALRWEDLNLPLRTVTIAQTLTRDADGHATAGTPKTETSAATVGFSRDTAAHLQRLKDAQRLTARTRPAHWRHDLVFPNRRGVMMPEHAQLNARLAKLCTAAGVPRLTAHELRHSGASAMIRAGVDPTTLSRLLRHKRPEFSLRLYTHSKLEDIQVAVTRLEDALAARDDERRFREGT